MSVPAHHQGEWFGTYTLVDSEAKILDQHEARLFCQFPQEGDYDYYQINRYT